LGNGADKKVDAQVPLLPPQQQAFIAGVEVKNRLPHISSSHVHPESARRGSIVLGMFRAISCLLMNIQPICATASSGDQSEWWTPRLIGPLLAAAVVRLILLVVSIARLPSTLARTGLNTLVQGDTDSYLEPGRNLLLHGSYASGGMPELFRTPGYSLFLAITSFAGVPAAAAANVLLSLLSVFLVWKLGRAVFRNDRIALGAAWIFAFEPLSVLNSVLLLSDTLFLVLFLLSMERLVVFLRTLRLSVLVAAGLWLTAATFVRPVTYYLPVALALGMFLVLWRQRALPSQPALAPGIFWKAPAVLLISVLPWLAAWQVRNWVETGYSGFSSITEQNFYFYIAADVLAQSEHRSLYDVQAELLARCGPGCGELAYLGKSFPAAAPAPSGWNQGWGLAFLHSESLRIIRAHFGIYLRSSVTHVLQVAFNPGEGSFNLLLDPLESMDIANSFRYKGPVQGLISLAHTYPWIVVEKAFFSAVLVGLYLLAARGLFRTGLRDVSIWLLLGTSLYFFAISAVAGGVGVTARYRLPMMPVVCLLAAAGVSRTKAVSDPS
jgi:4-amino-4-deoxy-L-arabinose transferase-like glycosyltransferase